MRILSSAVFMMMYGSLGQPLIVGQVRVAAGGGHVALIGELLGMLISELCGPNLLAFAKADPLPLPFQPWRATRFPAFMASPKFIRGIPCQHGS